MLWDKRCVRRSEVVQCEAEARSGEPPTQSALLPTRGAHAAPRVRRWA